MSAVRVLRWELRLPGCRSLKAKRAMIRSLKDRLRHRFKVSVAETDFQQRSDRAEVTVAFVTSDGRLAESMADKIERFVLEKGGARVVSYRSERLGPIGVRHATAPEVALSHPLGHDATKAGSAQRADQARDLRAAEE